MIFQTTPRLSIHFGMVCPPKPKFAFSNYPPAADLSANSPCFATTTGVRPKKVNYTFLFFPVHAFVLYNASVTVVQQLNHFRAPGCEEWELFLAIKTNMYSSRESKTAWVFCR